MSEDLYRIPPTRRQRMALTLAPLGLVLLVAAVAASLRDGVAWKLVGAVVAVLAVLLLGVAWGLQRSVALTEAAIAETRLDEAIVAASGPCGGSCDSVEAGVPAEASVSAEAGVTGAGSSPCFSGSGVDCANCLTRTAVSGRSAGN